MYLGEVREGMIGTYFSGLLNISHLPEDYLIKSAFFSDKDDDSSKCD